jgi:outer membrane protein, heavy metal efflux system
MPLGCRRLGPPLLCLMFAAMSFAADPPSAPQVMTLPTAVATALEHNPQLAVVRQQRGLAAGGVVIARVYPYNPTLESTVLAANGPPAAGVTNHVFNETILSLQMELRGQRRHRQAAAGAAVTRTEWEIAAQELAMSVNVIRAYNTALYRQQKLQVIEETIRLNEQIVERGKRLVEFAQARPADLILANSELNTARAQRGQGRAALAVALSDLRQLLGTLDDSFTVTGELDPPLAVANQDVLTTSALAVRPEIHARNAAVMEAEAQLRLQCADRYGNPTIGSRAEYNESRAYFVGALVNVPIPVLNKHQGEIHQRQSELARAQAELRQSEVQISQAVQAALIRLSESRKWADQYPAAVLPNLTKARQDMERLFAQNEQGVDVLRVIGVQSNLLRAMDAYLDARYEVSQALADLAAAVGDPAMISAPKPASEQVPTPSNPVTIPARPLPTPSNPITVPARP